jgi:hypothetical protein
MLKTVYLRGCSKGIEEAAYVPNSRASCRKRREQWKRKKCWGLSGETLLTAVSVLYLCGERRLSTEEPSKH